LIFAGSKRRKDRFSKQEQAFTMLKHRFSALMIFHDAETPKHHCAALFISPMLKHRCAALFISPMPKHR
jgi:hypothetical protein